MRPAGAFAGLQSKFIFHRHELAGIDKLLEHFWNVLFQLGTVALEIADQQVGQGFSGGANAVVGAWRTGKFADEENQGAETGTKITFRRAVALLADDLVVFTLQFAGVEQVGGNLVIDEISGDHRADGSRCGLFGGFKHDLQLRAQLGLGAGVVGIAQHPFPEAATGGQQRVVGDKKLVVLVGGGEAGILQMTRQFTLIGLHAGRNGGLLLRLLAQDGFADDAFDIGIGELDAHRKAGLKSLQVGCHIA